MYSPFELIAKIHNKLTRDELSQLAVPLRSVRTLLLWLVLACLLPAMIGAVVLFVHIYQILRVKPRPSGRGCKRGRRSRPCF